MTLTSADPNAREATPRPGFAETLRDRTILVHRQAERSGILADLLRGRATRRAYALLLRNLVPVYAALEAALPVYRRSPVIAPLADERLARLPSLVADLAAIAGENWATTYPLLPQAEIYAAALAATREDVPRLVAHAYARYLGDLSGGQILKPILARTLGLAPAALSFYDFADTLDPVAAKSAVRTALDTVPADGKVAASIVAEAIAAFHHNIALSEAVQVAAG